MSKSTGYLWVAVQLALLAGLIFAPAGPRLFAVQMWIGAIVQGAGLLVMLLGALQLGRALTPLPSPNTQSSLKTDGLFRFVRHPIYSGLLLWALARVLSSGGAWHALLFVALTILLHAKAAHEEKLLRDTFPDYENYAQHTPRFVPRLW